MSKQVNDVLKTLPLSRLSDIQANLSGERPKRYKDKKTAIKAVGNPSKQKLVLALAKTGGITVDEIENMFAIRRAYARDIISKLEQKGEKLEQTDEGKFLAS